MDGALAPDLRAEDVADLMEPSDTPFGLMQAVAPAEHLAETPARWTRPAVPLGTHQPAWPA